MRSVFKNDDSLFFRQQVIDETLSPTWDELLVFEEILVYGRREDIKAKPPTIIVEIYDQDKVQSHDLLMARPKPRLIFTFKVGKNEFLGRAIGKATVTLSEDKYKQPSLEWFQVYRGTEEAGELLAAFEMFEVGTVDGWKRGKPQCTIQFSFASNQTCCSPTGDPIFVTIT